MSWLARSIANTLKFDETDGDQSDAVVSNLNEDDTKNPEKQLNQNDSDSSSSSSPTSTPRGVKDDISELKKTLTRQFWGVASFLAPPPQSEPYKPLLDSESKDPDGKSIPGSAKDESESDPAGITGIRNDFAEIGGKFMTGISMFSNNVAVSEITKMASNFLQLESDNEEEGREGNNALPSGGAVGVTDEVVSFARDIAMHPETWLDFPLPEDDDDDFDVSDAQQEHALAVEQLAPRLAALRIELCPGYMSESCFWKIYFVLLHPRLDKKDAELLSTPQIVKARALLSHELKNRTKANLQDWSGEGTTDVQDISNNQHEEPLSVPTRTDPDNMPKTSFAESATFTAAAELEMEKHPIMSTEIAVSDKSVIEEKYIDRTNDQNMNVNSYNVLVEKDEDDADDWLKEETSEVGASGATIPIENEEDVSFSDLEEDDVDLPSSFKKTSNNSDKDTRDWVQLRKGSADSSDSTESRDAETAGSKKVNHIYPDSNETHDWLDVDDIDVA